MGLLLPQVRKLSIVSKDIGITKLEPNWAQTEYLAEVERQLQTTGHIRIIVLKARQLGVSTISEALLFLLCFMFDQYRALIVAHEERSAQRILDMTKLFWQHYAFANLYHLKYNSRNDMVWRENGSNIRVATAGRKGSEGIGRGDTIHGLHASELGFWDTPEHVAESLLNSIPSGKGTMIVFESTANGIGNYFERVWREAEAGEVEYFPLFFSWLRHPEYTAEHYRLDALDKPLTNLDTEERALQAIGANKSQLVWRRFMIRNRLSGDALKFAQEYPALPEQAFISTGTNVFNYPMLVTAYEPQVGTPARLVRDGNRITMEYDPEGPYKIYKAPDPDPDHGSYMVAGDPTRTRTGDYASAQVVNRHTYEQVAVFRSRVDPATFGQELFKLGMYYNRALVSSEVEGPSSVAIGTLLGMNYPNVYQRERPDHTPGKQRGDIWGWMTTRQSKDYMMGIVKKHLVDQTLTIHDPVTFQEMKDYVVLNNGNLGPADDVHGHDDTVMAYAQAFACMSLADAIPPEGSVTPPPWGFAQPNDMGWTETGAA